jgi:type 2 lantibiotic biosynthesis protein LanM
MLTLPTQSLLHEISAQASSLAERILNPAIIGDSEGSDAQVDQRLDQWCHMVAKGDRTKFLRRLAADGLTLEAVKPLLGRVQYADGHPLPPWTATLESIMQVAQAWRSPQILDWQFLPEQAAHPFEPFYGPCLQVANRQLAERLSPAQWQRLSPSAQVALQVSLLQRLHDISAGTLFEEFSRFRATGNALKDFFLLQLSGQNCQDKYHAFLERLFQAGFQPLFTTYPVLGRLIATAIEYWVEATTELIQRLVADWTDLEQQFSPQPLTQVIDLQLGLSDPHNRGRSTLILEFDTALKLVYKPKDLGPDVAYFQFLAWCNRHGLDLPFQCLQVLNRGTHGWVEYVNTLPCNDEAAVQRFYQRSGMLLCLVHLLEGTDCHYENLIAHGEQPVLIDTETLLTHRDAEAVSFRSGSDPTASAADLANQQLNDSVLRTLLLPQKGFSPNDLLEFDLSGFGTAQEYHQMVPQVKYCNRDTMQVEFVPESIQKNAHAPTLRGQPIASDNYRDDIVLGFAQMYDFLLQHQATLLAANSPLTAFANQTVRFIFRATNTYSKILQPSYRPQLLKSGIDRSLALEVLGRAVCVGSALPKFWPLLGAECQSMENMDIPFFTANSSQTHLTLSQGLVIPDLFVGASFDQVMLRVRHLSTVDRDQQIQMIYGSFEGAHFQEPPLGLVDSGRSAKSGIVRRAGCSPEQWLESATQIATQIRDTAIQASDGSVTWLGLVAKPNAEGFQFSHLKYDLCSGSSGIALFLAALAQVSGDPQWRDLALRTLQLVRQGFQAPDPEEIAPLCRQHGIGGPMGLAGIVYSFVQISDLLQAPELRLEAQAIAALMTPELVAADRAYDISRGVAGTLLGLLALPEDDHAYQLAIACGEHLLYQGQDADGKFKPWSTWNGRALTGFYQGVAGIAYALLRLFAMTQDERFRQAAIAAIAYEHSSFDPAARNWIDHRSNQLTCQASWAQGAPGIGLARLGGLSVLDTPEIRQDIAIALATTQKFALGGIDSLCWGNLGRLETLLLAVRQGHRPELQLMVEQAAAQLVGEAKEHGSFRLQPNSRSDRHIPGFLHGNAGIGYQLLRLVSDRLPSVLLWNLG